MSHAAFRIKPRFSDFNLQGILKGSLHFDFVCEAQLDAISSRYGLDFADLSKRGQKWNITDYRITFHDENRSLAPFLVDTEIVRLEGSIKEVAFAFWNDDRSIRHASGAIVFQLYDSKAQQYVPIPENDVAAFKKGGALKTKAI